MLVLYHRPARSPIIHPHHLVISMIAHIANPFRESTYLAQVTEHHLASTGLSMAKHLDSTLNLYRVIGVFRQGVIYAARVSPNSYS